MRPLRLEGVDASGRADELAHEEAVDADVGADVETHSAAQAHGRQQLLQVSLPGDTQVEPLGDDPIAEVDPDPP